MVNVELGVITVIGELREMVTERDRAIANLLKANEDLRFTISEANRKIGEFTKESNASRL